MRSGEGKEEWKDGRMGGWKGGRVEGWERRKGGRKEEMEALGSVAPFWRSLGIIALVKRQGERL